MKDKLLKLADACIENPDFYKYGICNNSTIQKAISYSKGSKPKRYIFQMDYLSHDDPYYLKCRSLHDTLYKQFKIDDDSNCLLVNSTSITINFEDSPSLYISLDYETKKFKESFVEIYKTTKFKKWFSEKIKPTGEKIKLKYTVEERIPFYKISSGSVSEKITTDEFNIIVENIKDNYKKFKEIEKGKKIVEDRKKIEERLEKYVK